MIFGYFTLFVALVISAIAAYYSIIGLTAIFSAAVIPIMIMGASLEIGKVTAAVWLKMYWERASLLYKFYLVPAVAFLMLLTSMGIFGFLSKAHSDQSLVSGDSMAKVAIYDEKIKIAKDNIDANRKALKQMDEAVDQVMGRSADEKGADKAVAIRRGQQRERARLLVDIEAEQRKIGALNEERAPLAAENRKIESEVGPIKYIAALVYGDNPDTSILEKAVRLVIIIIVLVFDPLALVLILAAQQSIRWAREDKRLPVDEPPVAAPTAPDVVDPIGQRDPDEPQTTVDLFAYLKQPFVHFKNLIPMVFRPEKSEHSIMDDAAAIVTPKEEPVKEIELPVTAKLEPDLTVYDDERLVSKFDKIDMDRPGDSITIPQEPKTEPAPVRVAEAAPGPNRGIMNPELYTIRADNGPDLGKASNTSFGNAFSTDAIKGDLYLRTDYLPNRLFKFNGTKWIEVDKDHTDVYAYEEEYIKHLISEIDTGRYDPESLTDLEREQIAQYLGRNA
jgi:hypothetical protein